MKYWKMKGKILTFAVFTLGFVMQLRSQDSTALVSAFFGLDDALPFISNIALCPGAAGMDGMPVNFKYPIDASTLSADDFVVVDDQGNLNVPLCAILIPANEDGENRTVLLVGELGTALTNPPVEVRIVDDLFTTINFSGESSCSEILNLNGFVTTNVVPLAEGPSLFFAQRIEGSINECNSTTQTIQVAWNGGVAPFIIGDTEEDLFQYYTGYSDSAGVLIAHSPVSIADINDNDNFHQLCFNTTKQIIKISMTSNTVEDPNQDPNPYSEIDVNYCDDLTSFDWIQLESMYRVYPNPFLDVIYVDNLKGDEYFMLYDATGQKFAEGGCSTALDLPETKPGVYFLTIISGTNHSTYKLLSR